MDGFGGRLKAERKRLGLNQQEFGKLAGCSRTTQYNYEREDASPDLEYIKKIKELGADIIFIISGQKADENKIYASPEDALMTVINVQTKMGVTFDAQQMKSLLGLAWSLQLNEDKLEQVVVSGYQFHGVEPPLFAKK